MEQAHKTRPLFETMLKITFEREINADIEKSFQETAKYVRL